MTDYLIRAVGVREALLDVAHDSDSEMDVDDYRVLDENETDDQRRLLGGYTDVWVLRPCVPGMARDLLDPSQRIVGVRVNPESGDTYQVLAQDGHPRSPWKFVGGEQAIADAFAILEKVVETAKKSR